MGARHRTHKGFPEVGKTHNLHTKTGRAGAIEMRQSV